MKKRFWFNPYYFCGNTFKFFLQAFIKYGIYPRLGANHDGIPSKFFQVFDKLQRTLHTATPHWREIIYNAKYVFHALAGQSGNRIIWRFFGYLYRVRMAFPE